MLTFRNRSFRGLSLALFVAFSAGCGTLDYRGVQAQFNEASRQDSWRTVSPATETTSTTQTTYADVLAKLTGSYIAKLDPRLQPNAWLLRALSEWRLDELSKAGTSAGKGLSAKPGAGSRDDILLRLVPSLVADRECEIAWRTAGKKLEIAQYDHVEPWGFPGYTHAYETAFEEWGEAMRAEGPATPSTTKYYMYYQRWRMIRNWGEIINSVEPEGDSDKADAAARKILTPDTESPPSLSDVAKAAAAMIPKAHPLHMLTRPFAP